jgi:hypothetical protein
MNIDNELLAGRYLKSSQFEEGPALLRISNVKRETLQDGESKFVVYFSNSQQGLVLNKTNGRAIRDMYGPQTEKWVGKTIVLFATICDFGGRSVNCIRVRSPNGADTEGNQDELPF